MYRARPILAVVSAVALAGPAAAQPRDQYHDVKATPLPLDRSEVWTLEFDYTPVRIATVDTPLDGKKRVWYMVYRVHNTTDTPHTIIPEFELVSKDPNGLAVRYLDQPTPAVLDQLRKIEDPTGALDIQSSISISEKEIPVTSRDSYPRYVHGIAVWPDVTDKTPDLNRFSVYVTGLSNGISAEMKSGQKHISRKALQIDFVRPTDNTRSSANDVRNNDNGGLGAVTWIYRPSTIQTGNASPPAGGTPDGR